ncbi:MAG: hypothetical protein LUQ59_12095, partial [Methanothrix sp.]|nr:hypothetical protein [Methanothrix sp.]
GLNDRALDIFRQVSRQDPLRPEPYMLGLKAARNANNIDGLRWTCLGILGQAWTKEQASIWQSGLGVAKEIQERFKSEKQDNDAKEFREEVDQAMVRDCVIVVRWTGDADVDLYVEEPTGTICSPRNPRTTAGGVMMGDILSQTDGEDIGGHSAVYVCPQGFDGKYKLLAWRIFGKVTSDKVSVEVITHFRGKNPICVRKKIPLENDKAVVAFELKNGRRNESLLEQQVASAAGDQLAANQQILSQEIAAALDPHAVSSLSADRNVSAATNKIDSNSGQTGVLMPAGQPDPSGYQPVIMWLPKGAQLRILPGGAVVSADRRYVRYTAMPIFSGVTSVYTYNTATGSSISESATVGSSSGM